MLFREESSEKRLVLPSLVRPLLLVWVDLTYLNLSHSSTSPSLLLPLITHLPTY